MASNYSPYRCHRDHFATNSQVSSQLVMGALPSTHVEVSIIIPTFRRAELLNQALVSALSQTDFPNYEVVVVDNDGEQADPATEDVIRRHLTHRVRYYRNKKNIGMTGNWNRGIELATGNWIAILHDDDWLAPTFLATMFGTMPSNANLATCAVLSGTHSYDPARLPPRSQEKPQWHRIRPPRLIVSNISLAPGVLMHKNLAVSLGGFDDDLYPCADYDFYIRATLLGTAYSLAENLAYYRTSDSQTYKGNTLQQIITVSSKMKCGLLKEFPSVTGFIFLINALREWRERADLLGRKIDESRTHQKIVKRINQNRAASLAVNLASRIAYFIEIRRSRGYQQKSGARAIFTRRRRGVFR